MAVHRLERAHVSLRGLALGDALGSQFFVPANRHLPASRSLPPAPWSWTDDTEMACAVVADLTDGGGRIDQDRLVARFARHYDFDRGYGPSTNRFLRQVRDGGDWRLLLGELFGGQGSWGNGAALRVAPLGAYHAGSPRHAARQATLSATVTHTHPEAVAGAVAVAVAACLVAAGQTSPGPLIDEVLEHVPPGRVHDGIRRARRLLTVRDPEAVAYELGNGRNVSARDTVPFTLWAAAAHLHDFAEAVWATAQAGGDVDTTCAIVAGIVAARLEPGDLPAAWTEAAEPLPWWVKAPPGRRGTPVATRHDRTTKPMRRPEPIPPPERIWQDHEWETIRLGWLPRSMEHKWFAYAEDDRLHLYRSWTGDKVYEVLFQPVPGGWKIAEAFTEFHEGRSAEDAGHMLRHVLETFLYRRSPGS